MKLSRNTVSKIIAGIAVFILLYLIWVLRKGLAVVAAPFITSVIITYLSRPGVHLLTKTKMKLSAAVLITFVTFAGIMGVALFFLIPELLQGFQRLTEMLPDIFETFNHSLQQLLVALEKMGLPEDMKKQLLSETAKISLKIPHYASELTKNLTDTMLGVFAFIANLVIAFVISYYFYVDGEKIKRFFLMLFPTSYRAELVTIGLGVDNALKGFIHGQLLAASVVGVLEFIGLTAVGVENAVPLAVIGGIANIIPYFGPVIGAIPAVAVALIQSPTKALLTLLIFVSVQQIDNSFVSPKIIEGRLGLHPLVSIFVVLLGGSCFGIPGLIFAVPLTAIFMVIIKRCIVLLSQRPFPRQRTTGAKETPDS